MALQADAAVIDAECCIAGDDGVTQFGCAAHARVMPTFAFGDGAAIYA